MDFSEIFPHTSPMGCQWSPNGHHLATAAKYQLVIRNKDMEIVHIFACNEVIEGIKWSPNSQHIVAFSFKSCLIQIFSLRDSQWKFTLEQENLEPGFTELFWAPDSQHLVIVADYQLFVSVWSLVACCEVAQVKNPKCSSSSSTTPPLQGTSTEEGTRGLHFSHRGRYMAVAQRDEHKDFIAIYDCQKNWALAKRFAVESKDMNDFAWSIDDRSICIWESAHISYKLMLVPLGSSQQQEKRNFELHKDQLAIKTVSWSPDTQYISVGSYDQVLRLINSRTWKVEAEFRHTKKPPRKNTTVVYSEVEQRKTEDASISEDVSTNTEPFFQRKSRSTVYVVNEESVQIESAYIEPKQPNPSLGIGSVSWSHDSKYLFSRNDNMPNVLWVWDACAMSLCSLIIQRHPIRFACWHPTTSRLALCTGSRAVYIWSPAACASCELPQDDRFHVRNLCWNPDGSCLLLVDSKSFCCCYFSAEALTDPQTS